MALPVKPWANYPPNTGTPINAAALAGLENRVANYVGAVGMVGPGTFAYEDFRVKQHGAGDMTVDVGLPTTLMGAYIALDALGSVERYEYNGLQMNQAIAAADPTNPRVDRIVLVPNSNVDSQTPTLAVVAGIPTAGATLDNLNGAQAVAAGRLLLADVLVGAAAVSIPTANIRDRRTIVTPGAASPFSGIDGVMLEPHKAMMVTTSLYTQGSNNTATYAMRCSLPRRIVGATRIRWKYVQGSAQLTGNYIITICDDSGRPIVGTGSVAITGAANAGVVRSEVIAATTFEAGNYFAMISLNTLSATGNINVLGGQIINVAGGQSVPSVPGAAYVSGIGTPPAAMTPGVFTDVTAAVVTLGAVVPLMMLTVG